MNYWLDLFTGTTWEEFQAAGATTAGFREGRKNRAKGIRPGDTLLCYLVGVKRWVGLLEVSGELFEDNSPIYQEEVFPVRFPVKPLVLLPPEQGIPMEQFEGKLSFFPIGVTGKQWSGNLRGSPTRYKAADGLTIAEAIRAAAANPTSRPVSERQLRRSSNLYKLQKPSDDGQTEEETVVTVPSNDEADASDEAPVAKAGPSHTEIQWRLANLGSEMGLNVWIPKGDRGRSWNSNKMADIPKLLESLPNQFQPATQRTIENIDVLWLSGISFVGAFEIEHSTSIYSGLLRMSDLISMQPNIDIKLYLVAPDERYEKFIREVPRPTFAGLKKPLHSICRFVPYSTLCERLDEVKNVLRYIRPEFIDEIAEMYDPAEDFAAL